jgi:autotransporter translocation and assembly factor TamB
MQKLCIQLFFVLLLLAGVDGASYISESYMNSKIIRSSINDKKIYCKAIGCISTSAGSVSAVKWYVAAKPSRKWSINVCFAIFLSLSVVAQFRQKMSSQPSSPLQSQKSSLGGPGYNVQLSLGKIRRQNQVSSQRVPSVVCGNAASMTSCVKTQLISCSPA